jgi:putative sterol carrier protein
MADFLSAEWLAALNDTLGAAGPVPLVSPASVFRVAFEFSDAPSSTPHALTFTINAEGASVESGDHLAANTVVRLSYKDAEALTAGTLDSASALREGRLKVRGDVHALVPLLTWLHAAK